MGLLQEARSLTSLIVPERIRSLDSSPDLGPKLLFFSGGTALRSLCRQLKRYTHNSIHLITPFDSGGSSAEIRRAFGLPSVGDLRNRLVALADEGNEANGAIYRLFCYRLPKDRSSFELCEELARLARGEHELMQALPAKIRRPLCETLAFIEQIRPVDFQLRGANVGNLLVAGIALSHDREIDTAVFMLGRMLGALGVVTPTTEVDAQLAARLVDGSVIVGQHVITGKEVPAIASPVDELFLTRALTSPEAFAATAAPRALALIEEADLICYPYGSFYSSIVANLLPSGIGRTIASVPCPKVYVPNWGQDPEQLGMTLAGTVERLLAAVRADAPGASTPSILRRVLIDSQNLHYSLKLDTERVQQLGVEVLDLPFAAHTGVEVDFERLAQLLVSLS